VSVISLSMLCLQSDLLGRMFIIADTYNNAVRVYSDAGDKTPPKLLKVLTEVCCALCTGERCAGVRYSI
jgi:hypothetical protein